MARELGEDLTHKVSTRGPSGVKAAVGRGQAVGTMGCLTSTRAGGDLRGHLPHLHPEKQQSHQCHSWQMLFQCFLPLEIPVTMSPDPLPPVHICAVTSASHSAVFCHPPSQSIMFCLSYSVLFCSFFCSLPACSFSNS